MSIFDYKDIIAYITTFLDDTSLIKFASVCRSVHDMITKNAEENAHVLYNQHACSMQLIIICCKKHSCYSLYYLLKLLHPINDYAVTHATSICKYRLFCEHLRSIVSIYCSRELVRNSVENHINDLAIYVLERTYLDMSLTEILVNTANKYNNNKFLDLLAKCENMYINYRIVSAAASDNIDILRKLIHSLVINDVRSVRRILSRVRDYSHSLREWFIEDKSNGCITLKLRFDTGVTINVVYHKSSNGTYAVKNEN